MTLAKPTILVTGAAGFIAFHLIEDLLKNGFSVIGIDNLDPFYPREQKQRNLSDISALRADFTFIQHDISQSLPESLGARRIECVVHLAAKAGVRSSIEHAVDYVEANVTGTVRLLEFCRTHNIRRVIFGSSSSVYGDDTPTPFHEDAAVRHPRSPYAASKRAAELYCATYASLYHLSVIALRFFSVYGPRQRPDLAIHSFAKLLTAGQPIPLFGNGKSCRDYTYVSDIVAGIRGALRAIEGIPAGRCEIVNLGSHRPVSLLELVERLERAFGEKAQIEWKDEQPGDVRSTFADIRRAARLFAYQPKVDLDQGLRHFADWFLAQPTTGRGNRKAA